MPTLLSSRQSQSGWLWTLRTSHPTQPSLRNFAPDDDALATKVEQFFTRASQRKAAALLAVESGKWDGLPDMAESPTASLALLIGRIEAAAQELDKADKPEELASCRKNWRNWMTVSDWGNILMRSRRTLDTRKPKWHSRHARKPSTRPLLQSSALS